MAILCSRYAKSVVIVSHGRMVRERHLYDFGEMQVAVHVPGRYCHADIMHVDNITAIQNSLGSWINALVGS